MLSSVSSDTGCGNLYRPVAEWPLPGADMAHLLSVMMAASVVAGQDVRHVLAGQEYRYTDQAGAEVTI